jgi:hypothetical protein
MPKMAMASREQGRSSYWRSFMCGVSVTILLMTVIIFGTLMLSPERVERLFTDRHSTVVTPVNVVGARGQSPPPPPHLPSNAPVVQAAATALPPPASARKQPTDAAEGARYLDELYRWRANMRERRNERRQRQQVVMNMVIDDPMALMRDMLGDVGGVMGGAVGEMLNDVQNDLRRDQSFGAANGGDLFFSPGATNGEPYVITVVA